MREEGVSEVEALRLRVREARGGEGQPGLGNGRDSPAGAPRAHLEAHTSARTHGHAGWHPHLARALAPTRLCPRAHAHTHAQTQTRADTLTPGNLTHTGAPGATGNLQ